MKELLIVFTPAVCAPIDDLLHNPLKKDSLDLFEKSIQQTKHFATHLEKDIYIFFDKESDLRKVMETQKLRRFLKLGIDQGEKIFNSFLKGFIKDYSSIVLLRHSTPEVTEDLVAEAFSMLKSNDYILGPLMDGDYYLIGMKKLDPFIFDEHQHGRPDLYKAMIEYFKSVNASFYVMPILNGAPVTVAQG